MPVVTSIFLVISLVLAVVLGPQTRPWSWGPAMIALGISTLAALPAIWRRGKAPADFSLIGFATLTAAWFAWRAWNSPAPEYAQADLLLLSATIGVFVCIRGIAGNVIAERILSWGVALLLLANLIVIGMQIADPSYTPVFRSRAIDQMISGFFAHYNEAANYLIASSMLVGAAALFGGHSRFIRIVLGLIALAGLAGVWFTHSRGGILGAAVACGVFAAFLLIIGKRREARWFAPALIAIPVIGLVIGGFWLMGWENAQEARKATDTSVTILLDNDCRLYFLGLAVSCIGLHPMFGGGSRSFTWECYGFWDNKIQGFSGHKPELVHNEIMQSATDYGLIGAGLLIGLLGTIVLVAILRTLFEDAPQIPDSRDAWRLGGAAALAGMLVQSCFSFVFHSLPGVLLLGVCLGLLSRSNEAQTNARTIGTRIFLSITAILCAAVFLPFGWKGTQVTHILWPVYFSKQAVTSSESRIDMLTEALRIWPQAELYQNRAMFLQKSVSSSDQADFQDAAQRAVADYHAAAELQPFDPANFVNLAVLSSRLNLDQVSEATFAKAIRLQGGTESMFRGHYSLANHLLEKGLRQAQNESPQAARVTLESAAEQIEKAVSETPPWVITTHGTYVRISIHESLGTLREADGDYPGALECYDFAAKIQGGTRAHYRAGVLISRKAVKAWEKRRASEAMALFIEAKMRFGQAGNQLPQGVTPSQRLEFLEYLDRSIAFLKGAKVVPEKK